MQHKTEDFKIHLDIIQWCVQNGLGFVATEHQGTYYIEFTGAY